MHAPIDQVDLLNARSHLQQLLPEQYTEAKSVMSFYMVEGYFFACCCAPVDVAPSVWLDMVWNGPCPLEGSELDLALKHLMTVYGSIAQAVEQQKAVTAVSARFVSPLQANLEPQSSIAQWTHGFVMGHIPNAQYWEQLSGHPDWEEDLEVTGFSGANLTVFLNQATAEDTQRDLSSEFKTLDECLAYFKGTFEQNLHNYSVCAQNLYDLLRAAGIDPSKGS